MATSSSDAAPATNHLALAALLLGGMAIGGSPIFVRLSEVGPMGTAFWRVAIAFLPLLLWPNPAGAIVRNARPQGLSDYFWLAAPGVFLAADLAAWHLALHMTSVANATLLANLAPIFVTLGSWLLFRSRVSGVFLMGLALAVVGVIVLKGGPAALGDGHLAGDATAAFAAVFYAGYILVIGRLRSRFSTRTIMLWSTATAAVCMLPIALIFETDLLPLTMFGWAMLVGLAFVSHAGGQGMITFALAFLPPAFSSLTLLLQPVVAAILAWVLLSEPIGLVQAIGGVIVICGILVARRG
ncbi:DMT family transporter [Phyllobacterium sp. 21LDTY02-6]|jgi:drug/metabolite transporter (DMT)-like permease|uniref:DMT family transporter n=1 Tax=unclassified Phyllobacterium TaxID=2638441 RepID=UPI00201FCD81|nr:MULTISPECIES: DMT family transporter [unclassified Phyllobacterium]MCO4317685.1 DMT family transporter [Phyllobacterium sp. 21LDTY02-6]MCX8281464.1 DMT family transporter [Phyllobacterium sp. 0TCS1.6C]MCX8292940.1 DMT family transporter [Phyllobacterium sp. 0TCS1.6A]